jgi:hypothetical protein
VSKKQPDRERCPGCNRILALYAPSLPNEGEGPYNLGEWTVQPCHYCERIKPMPFKMTAGKAWRLPDYDKPGTPTIVDVSKEVAKRARYMGDVRWDEGWRRDAGYEEKGAQACAKFKDEKTGEVYYQPVEAT